MIGLHRIVTAGAKEFIAGTPSRLPPPVLAPDVNLGPHAAIWIKASRLLPIWELEVSGRRKLEFLGSRYRNRQQAPGHVPSQVHERNLHPPVRYPGEW